MKAISNFPVLTCKRQLMLFVGMDGYYRQFCHNVFVIAEPLVNLLSKRANGQSSFGIIIARMHLLYSKPS